MCNMAYTLFQEKEWMIMEIQDGVQDGRQFSMYLDVISLFIVLDFTENQQTLHINAKECKQHTVMCILNFKSIKIKD